MTWLSYFFLYQVLVELRICSTVAVEGIKQARNITSEIVNQQLNKIIILKK